MKSSTYSDQQIIQQLKARNNQAAVAILNKYGNALYGVIYRKVGSEDLACAAMKRAFVNIWQQFQMYDATKEPLFNWLIKMVNQSLDTDMQRAA